MDGKPIMSSDSLCPCSSEKPYSECCEPYHTDKAIAPSALELMRSRYSAFVMGLADYIIATTHRENHEYIKNTALWKIRLNAYLRTLEGQGLEIKDFEPGETRAYVTFHANLLVKGQPATIKEKSLFFKVGKRWLYHSAEYQK